MMVLFNEIIVKFHFCDTRTNSNDFAMTQKIDQEILLVFYSAISLVPILHLSFLLGVLLLELCLSYVCFCDLLTQWSQSYWSVLTDLNDCAKTFYSQYSGEA